jgi:hypothetical protein
MSRDGYSTTQRATCEAVCCKRSTRNRRASTTSVKGSRSCIAPTACYRHIHRLSPHTGNHSHDLPSPHISINISTTTTCCVPRHYSLSSARAAPHTHLQTQPTCRGWWGAEDRFLLGGVGKRHVRGVVVADKEVEVDIVLARGRTGHLQTASCLESLTGSIHGTAPASKVPGLGTFTEESAHAHLPPRPSNQCHLPCNSFARSLLVSEVRAGVADCFGLLRISGFGLWIWSFGCVVWLSCVEQAPGKSSCLSSL